jgi:hypothetical protein
LSVEFGYVDGPMLWKQLDQWRAAIKTTDNTVLTNRLVDLCGIELFLRSFFAAAKAAPTSPPESVLAAC